MLTPSVTSKPSAAEALTVRSAASSWVPGARTLPSESVGHPFLLGNGDRIALLYWGFRCQLGALCNDDGVRAHLSAAGVAALDPVTSACTVNL